jgi:hypothetical protein
MTDHSPTTAAKATLLPGLGNVLLKELLSLIEGMGEAVLEKKISANVKKSHPFPPAPTDADKTNLIRHTTRQLVKVTLRSGGLADRIRDILTPHLSPAVLPKLTAGMTTEQGVHVVISVLVADINAMLGV